MTNTQGFFQPTIKLLSEEKPRAVKVIPGNEKIVFVKWLPLHGDDNNNILTTMLINSVQFIGAVSKSRSDFIKNHNNKRKYPKMEDSDWK